MSDDTFKDAVYRVVHKSKMPAKAQCEMIGLSYSMLSNAANPNLEDFNLRGDKIVPLTLCTNNFAILDHMERMVGRVAFKLPSPASEPSQLHSHLSKTVKEFSDVLQSYDQAMADGKLTRAEARTIKKEADELISELMSWVETVRETAEGGRLS